VLAKIPNAILAIVGEGDLVYAELCKRRVAELGLEASVRFVGHRNDAPQVLAACDLLLHTSCHERPDQGTVEAFGRVLIEAMAVARPVIATKAGGPPELVVDGETGLLINPDDVDDLAAKTIAALSDPEWRRRAGEAGQARAAALYTQRAATERTLALYEQVLRESRGNAGT
jgi:glycosyltransferase involved in cell wall biosynthesis